MNQVMLKPALSGMSKTAIFVVMGAIASFSLFVLMGKLIENENLSFNPPQPGIEVSINNVAEEKPPITKPKPMPEPPKVTTPPQRPEVLPDESNQLIAMDVNFGVQIPPTTLGPLNFDGPRDNSATPIVRVQPKYPIKAARDGIEGWVSLSFSIDPVGRVTNVSVIDSQPNRVFDNEAKKALKRWKYKPQIKDGKAIRVDHQSVLLEFKLGQS